MTYPIGPVKGKLTSDGTLHGRLSGGGTLSGGLSVGTAGSAPIYDGPYEFTPTQETQVVEIANQQAAQDIIINPIPSNYGLITRDGTVLIDNSEEGEK